MIESTYMRVLSRGATIALSIYLVAAFSLAAPLHSLISHDDTVTPAEALALCDAEYGYGHCPSPTGDTPDSHHQTSQWAYIHSVLGNEGKKIFGILPHVTVSEHVPVTEHFTFRLFIAHVRTGTDKQERLLSRGVLAYRRFG